MERPPRGNQSWLPFVTIPGAQTTTHYTREREFGWIETVPYSGFRDISLGPQATGIANIVLDGVMVLFSWLDLT